ncbi:hypothetical protein G7070_08195 [Propioniciclava coleopterorum]|uniref:Uncharacterized protein n=1 Tax=Propioniciclava coleopterorum TaxID=2714937 RepID=A0A6G7Y6F0_9ACTN|nr:hypothetical protein [Propioniciclava coleopterorum]QIK72256.1 hypothetical protein G7070_08195 [Propioniciclava coleopterorum]
MTETVERMLPLYEAKMIHQFDHRWATYEADGSVRDVTLAEKQDPGFAALPRYWVREEVVRDRLGDRWDRDWLLGWRDICRSTDVRTLIATINGGRASPEGGTLLAFPDPAAAAPALLAIWNSFAFDFVARLKVGGTHLKYFTMRQLPVPHPDQLAAKVPWGAVSWRDWLGSRALRLILDSDEMLQVSREFDATLPNDPWDADQRRWVRAELDAGCFHLFGIVRSDVDYVMETFPIVKRKDEAEFGSYRTKEQILEVYDVMQAAIASGTTYSSPLDADIHPAGGSDD